jgi:hypothetical protein
MSERLEWDYPPTMRQRRNRRLAQGRDRVLPMDGEILEPEPEQRIRVEVHHAYQPQRQREQIPGWLIALLVFAGLLWLSPIGLIVAIAIVSIFVIQHPVIVITSGLIVAALVINSLRRRRVAIRGN